MPNNRHTIQTVFANRQYIFNSLQFKRCRNISKSREIADWLWKNAFNYDRFALVYKFTTEYAANWTDKEPLNELSSTLKTKTLNTFVSRKIC